MSVLIKESTGLAATATTGGRLRIKIIDAGEGSSGTYSPALLKQAAKDKVFSKGTHMYADHPGAQESWDRPERTIKDLAAVLETDAEYVEAETALYAEAKVFPNWREVIREMADSIGVSIRASAEVDDSNGKRVITKLVHAESVDFVTHAGRGGKIAEVLESSRAARRAVKDHGVAEATANELRDWLRLAVRDAYPSTEGDGYRYAWVQDFDDTTVWYEVEQSGDGAKLYQQGYTVSGNTVSLEGDPVEVRIETRYVPVTADPAADAAESAPTDSPSNPAGVTENRKGSPVTTTTIEESALAALKAQASRATVLEADNKTLREAGIKSEAAKIVAEAFEGIDAPKTQARLAESYKLTESGELNAAALKLEAEESAAEWKVSNGAGSVTGVGETKPLVQEAATVSNQDILSALKGDK